MASDLEHELVAIIKKERKNRHISDYKWFDRAFIGSDPIVVRVECATYYDWKSQKNFMLHINPKELHSYDGKTYTVNSVVSLFFLRTRSIPLHVSTELGRTTIDEMEESDTQEPSIRFCDLNAFLKKFGKYIESLESMYVTKTRVHKSIKAFVKEKPLHDVPEMIAATKHTTKDGVLTKLADIRTSPLDDFCDILTKMQKSRFVSESDIKEILTSQEYETVSEEVKRINGFLLALERQKIQRRRKR